MRRDSGSYYLLGYYSSNSKRDGKFRQIKVQVTLPGARLKHRPGYFAPKSFEQFTQSDKERQLEEAVSSERPFSEVPFLVAALHRLIQCGLFPLVEFFDRGYSFQQKARPFRPSLISLARYGACKIAW